MLSLTIALATASWARAVEIIHVPGTVSTLSAAISMVSDGGIIELAPGVYPVPAGGFVLNNLGKGFTIRAPEGEQAVLDAASGKPVLRIQNTDPGLGRPITFERITFYRGRSTTNGISGGVTLTKADATFVDCVFQQNTAVSASAGGAGTLLFSDSTGHFIGCEWIDNSIGTDGGGLRIDESTAYLHACQVTDNVSNLPNHRNTSAGGGIHVTNGTIRVGNTRFEGNEAGYAGGGLYALGTWTNPVSVPRADVVVANCTFVDNHARPDASVTPPTPTEGGGLHVEAQSLARVYSSRFVTNTAEVGAGLNLHRSTATVDASVFRGNLADDNGGGTGVGGAISIGSNDLAEDGSNNRPSADLTITDTYIQGRYGAVGATARIAGAIYATGDVTRRWGLAGVSPPAGPAETRAMLTLDGVALADCDAAEAGGGILVDLTDLAIGASLIIKSNVTDSGSGGGALRAIAESIAAVVDSTIATSSASQFGGGVYLQGADLEIDASQLIENQVGSVNYGAAIFSAPLESFYNTDIDATGEVHHSVISNTSNLGMPVFDDDRQPTPINDIRYNSNTMFERQSGNAVYSEALVGVQTVSQLNALVVHRAGGPSTDKSLTANTNPSVAPVVGRLLAVPSTVLPVTAAGDPESSTESYLAYAYSGGSATLDGSPVAGGSGYTTATVGSHTLRVAGQDFTASVTQGSAPSASLAANPAVISGGQSSTLQWTTTSGTFVDATIDQGVTITPAASGQVVVTPAVTTTYRLIVVTEQGTAVDSVTVWVDEVPGAIFSDGFESGDTDEWSSVVP
ncbi:MAG: hypothetical protein MUC56_15250 [Thermoanaerobaculales bacterium]|jgi:hypothetical protein|nr:hypothetical protein [Thermoanaerobaculales bacterium]